MTNNTVTHYYLCNSHMIILIPYFVYVVERPLTDFECPYLSLATVNKHFPHRITIRMK